MSEAAQALPEVAEVSPVETPEIAPAESAETAPETPQAPEPEIEVIQPAPEADDLSKLDWRTVPAEMRELLKQNPALKGMYFTNQAYRKAFSSPKQAEEIKQTLETLGGIDAVTALGEALNSAGGLDGIKELQSEVQDIRKLDELMNSGDPQALDVIVQTFPESFSQLMTAGIQKWAVHDLPSYNYVMSQIINRSLEMSGIPQNLGALEQALGANNPEQAKQALSQIKQALDFYHETGSRPPQPKLDPERQKLEAERAEFQKQKMGAFQQGVNVELNSYIGSQVRQEVSSFLKGRVISDGAFNHLDRAIRDELGKILSEDKNFVSQRNAFFERQDKEGMVRLYKTKLGKILPETARKVAKEFYTDIPQKPAAKPAQPAAKAQAAPGWTPIRKPADMEKFRSLIDYTQTTDDMLWENKAVLKDKRKVTWTD